VGSQTDGMRENVGSAGPRYLYCEERNDCAGDGTILPDDIAACTGALRVGVERKSMVVRLLHGPPLSARRSLLAN
jgi:hypothetical protein